jgi:hypothetical protein
MTIFFTKRQRVLAGLPAEDATLAPTPPGPPRCCDQGKPDTCYCTARGWKCPVHGATSEPCNPRFTHD